MTQSITIEDFLKQIDDMHQFCLEEHIIYNEEAINDDVIIDIITQTVNSKEKIMPYFSIVSDDYKKSIQFLIDQGEYYEHCKKLRLVFLNELITYFYLVDHFTDIKAERTILKHKLALKFDPNLTYEQVLKEIKEK